MSGQKRNSNHLYLSEPKSKYQKFQSNSKFNSSLPFTFNYQDLNKIVLLEVNLQKLNEKMSLMEKKIEKLESKKKIQIKYIQELENTNSTLQDDVKNLEMKIKKLSFEKKNLSIPYLTHNDKASNKIQETEYEMSYIS